MCSSNSSSYRFNTRIIEQTHIFLYNLGCTHGCVCEREYQSLGANLKLYLKNILFIVSNFIVNFALVFKKHGILLNMLISVNVVDEINILFP